jgi:chemotaxis protein methyltransferase CheR
MVGWRNRTILSSAGEATTAPNAGLGTAPAQKLNFLFSRHPASPRGDETLAQAIVDALPVPLVVLDRNLRVVTANRAFHLAFGLDPAPTLGQAFCGLSGGAFDTAGLRLLLARVLTERGTGGEVEVEHGLGATGPRRWLATAREIPAGDGGPLRLLLGIEDITARRLQARQAEDLSRHKDNVLAEIQHRIANSLQIVASIISMKARRVDSAEARGHLEDIHARVMAIAAVQASLQLPTVCDAVDVLPYLSKLCRALSSSMVSDSRRISLRVCGTGGRVTARRAESLGLLVTELVINSLKHAFDASIVEGAVTVTCDIAGEAWSLSVADNGHGKRESDAPPTSGLGTGILKALAGELDATIATVSGPSGTIVTIIHGEAATVSPATGLATTSDGDHLPQGKFTHASVG